MKIIQIIYTMSQVNAAERQREKAAAGMGKMGAAQEGKRLRIDNL